MWVSVAVLTLHVGANWLLIHRLGWGYLGAAWATALVRRPPRHARAAPAWRALRRRGGLAGMARQCTLKTVKAGRSV